MICDCCWAASSVSGNLKAPRGRSANSERIDPSSSAASTSPTTCSLAKTVASSRLSALGGVMPIVKKGSNGMGFMLVARD